MIALFWIHLAVTWYMVGLIWFVQIVHYPLFAKVSNFTEYEQQHTRRTAWVTAPFMLVELGTGCALVWYDAGWVWVTNLVGVGLLWASTFLIQIPCHNRLTQGFDVEVHRRLVQSNWLRTFLWTGRGILLMVEWAMRSGKS